MSHNVLTHMLFVDAIVGVGFPHRDVAVNAERGGLAKNINHDYVWSRTALNELDLPTLQDLYTGLKLHEVTYAH